MLKTKDKIWEVPSHKCDFVVTERIGPLGHHIKVMRCKVCGKGYVPDPNLYKR